MHVALQLESAFVLCLVAEIGKVRQVTYEGTAETRSETLEPSPVCLVSKLNPSDLG